MTTTKSHAWSHLPNAADMDRLPNAAALSRVVDQAWSLTAEQSQAIGTAWSANFPPIDRAINVAVEAVDVHRVWSDVTAVVRSATRFPALIGSRNAAVWAVRALAMGGHVGRHGFTQEHTETLMAPWISVMGDPRTV